MKSQSHHEDDPSTHVRPGIFFVSDRFTDEMGRKKTILNDPTDSTVVLALEEETGLAQLQKMQECKKIMICALREISFSGVSTTEGIRCFSGGRMDT